MERICKHCRLYNAAEGVCAVTVMHLGEKWELPVKPHDECHWERIDREIQQEIRSAINTAPTPYFRENLKEEAAVPIEIRQVRMWSDGVNGYLEHPADEE